MQVFIKTVEEHLFVLWYTFEKRNAFFEWERRGCVSMERNIKGCSEWTL